MLPARRDDDDECFMAYQPLVDYLMTNPVHIYIYIYIYIYMCVCVCSWAAFLHLGIFA